MQKELFDSVTQAISAPAFPQTLGDKPYEISPATDSRQMWSALKQPWSATPQGRLAIRSVSRGVLGAAFYAWGTQKAVKDMSGYNVDNPQNALQHIARAIDKVAGEPLIKVFNKMGLDGQEMVSFRPSRANGARTLGEDAIFNTFDFAMASTGDALGRNIIGLFDPNTPKKWKGEDGKIHFPQAMKSLAATAGRIFEAQAEDWFVAVPYTFQQKFQRKLINRFSPGFEYAADSTLHGSSFKLDQQGNIVGTYAWEGALDLQGRFTGYNFGTAIYRDLSKAVKGKLREFTDHDHHKPVKLTPFTMFDAGRKGVTGTARYLLNRGIKTTFIMLPSIPLFSLLRIPQSKHRGMGIMPDGTQVDLTQRPDFDPYAAAPGTLDKVLNPFGEVAHNLSVKLSGVSSNTVKKLGADAANQAYASGVADAYVNATIAYTPYIYAKTEFAHHWDNPDMDHAINKAIDGVFSGNFHAVKSGIGELRHAFRFRNAEAVERDRYRDENRPCHFTDKVQKRQDENGKYTDIAKRSSSANWQEQVSSRNEPELGNSR